MKAEKQEKNKCQILNEKLWIGKTKIAIVPCSSGSRSGGLGALYKLAALYYRVGKGKAKGSKAKCDTLVLHNIWDLSKNKQPEMKA